jgi:hypothetical protein
MSSTIKRVFGLVLTFAFIFALSTESNAQSWRRWRDRDRDFSGGQRAAIIGGSAAAGALIGGLLGGGKGAAIGAAIGAGGGTGAVVIHDRSNNDRDWRGRNYRGGRFFVEDGRFNRGPRFVNGRFFAPGQQFRGVRGFRGDRCR